MANASSAAVRCGWLLAIAVGLWCVLAGPAWAVSGASGLAGLSISAGLCVPPGLLVVWLTTGLPYGSPRAAWLILAGMGLRLAIVLAGTLVIRFVRPELGFREFLVWLLCYYLVMLLAETVLTLRRPSGS